MEQTHIDEIIGCLPKGRTLFPYFKDRYALVLLSYFVDSGKPMHAIKQSRFRGLLATGHVGRGGLERSARRCPW